MEYNHKEIEARWQKYWKENAIYKTEIDSTRPKYYVLDMFPYPSGAGLHVGHPLGYIASDIYSRYKRQQGFNVLHPMGYDAYGLPAEQFAIQTGQHPEVTTRKNIARYREQLDKIGFCYDWNREIKTCEPQYYKWTQWAFIKMFESYYDTEKQKACPIGDLIEHFSQHGTKGIKVACGKEIEFTAEEWNSLTEKEQQLRLMNYRIAYQGETMVNWCPKLGTVLANDEVSEGVSLRGGYPVEQKLMNQWCLRVSAYAQRLLDGLDGLDWTESLKETQRNWIGRSEGAEMKFKVADSDIELEIFTTRADTIFGVTFMVLAPESKYVDKVVSVAASPYGEWADLEAAAHAVKNMEGDLIVLDCIGYTQKMKEMFAEVGENCYIESPFYSNFGGGHIHFGKGIYCNFGCTFVDDTHIYVGDYTMFGPNVVVATAGHPLLPELREQGYQYNIPVHIGKNCWLGAGVLVMPGVTIGDNSVIGAGSVVTHDIPANVIAAGNPCRVLREISEEDKKNHGPKLD